MNYTAEAQEFISDIKEFDKEGFETWFKKGCLVGDGHINLYLSEKVNWNTKAVPKGEVLDLTLSDQAKCFADSLKEDIDWEDFKIWFSNGITIKSNYIKDYNFFKYKQKARIIQPKMQVINNGK